MEQIKELKSYIDTMGVYLVLTDKNEEGKDIEPIIAITIDGIKIGDIKLKEYLDWLNFWMPSLWLPQII